MAEYSHHEACPGCSSKDNLARYDDGSAFCFGCSHHEKSGSEEGERAKSSGRHVPMLYGEARPLPKRRIDEKTCQKFRYLIGDTNDGRPVQMATYFDSDGKPCAQKLRFADKSFAWIGEPKRAGLFGQQLCRGGGRQIVITEGEIDALSVAQAMGLKWEVVSVPDGAPSAKKAVAKASELLETYDRVVLMFDEDEPGREAAVECAEILSPGKAYIAQLPVKDANEMLLAGNEGDIVRAVWDAAPYRPDGIIEGVDLWDTVSIAPERGLPFPWPSLDEKLYGMRTSSITTWCGGSGTGKSQLVKEIAYCLTTVSGERVGILSLEESLRHAATAQMSLHLNRTLHVRDVWDRTTAEEREQAFKATVGSGQYCFYNHEGAVDAEHLLPKIRFMAVASDVRWVILDHISIMVSGTSTQGDERKRIDELMTKLRQLSQELDIGIHIVSHLRKADGTPHEEGGRVSLRDLRGSGAIGQISNVVIAAERDQQDPDNPNRMTLRILKDRFTGATGVACALDYNSQTGRLVEADEDEDPTLATPGHEEDDF